MTTIHADPELDRTDEFNQEPAAAAAGKQPRGRKPRAKAQPAKAAFLFS